MKKILLIGTGGTIASGRTEEGLKPILTAEDILSFVPDVKSFCEIDFLQVCNIDSSNMTPAIWSEIAGTIRKQYDRYDGFVITHGTDTMEETAYFLNLTLKTDKPVVLTGAMRPSTALSADGPLNLYEAVCLAASEEAVGQGVLIVFSDRIYAARSMSKTSTYSVMAISAGEVGSNGIIRDGKVYLYESPSQKHTLASEFDVSGLDTLPKVSVLYFSVDADPGLLRYAAEHSDGLVIAGAGAGEFSLEWIDIINSLTIPVVISSRINDGIITKDNLLCKNTIAANTLSPQKAAILLRLALAKDPEISQDSLEELFLQY
jgi:L-asparaginase